MNSQNPLKPPSQMELGGSPTPTPAAPVAVPAAPKAPVAAPRPAQPVPGAPARPQHPQQAAPRPAQAAPGAPARPQYPQQAAPRPAQAAPGTPARPQYPQQAAPRPAQAAPGTPARPQYPQQAAPRSAQAAPGAPTRPQYPQQAAPRPAQPVPGTTPRPGYVPPKPPVAQAPVAQEPENKLPAKPKKQAPLAVRIVLRIVAVLLSITLFFAAFVGILIYDGRQITDEENLRELLEQLLSDDYKDTEVMQAMQEEMVYWVDYLCNNNQYYQVDLNENAINSFLDKSTIEDFLAEKLTGYVTDILSGSRKTKVSTREMLRLYEENKSLMERELGIYIDSDMDYQIRENLKEIDVDGMMEENVFDYLEEEDDLGEILGAMSDVFSETTFIVCCIVVGVLIILLVLCNRLRPAGSLIHSGIPLLLAGAFLYLPLLAVDTFSTEIINAMSSDVNEDMTVLISSLITDFSPNLTMAPLVVMISGGVFILAGIAWKIVFKIIKKK